MEFYKKIFLNIFRIIQILLFKQTSSIFSKKKNIITNIIFCGDFKGREIKIPYLLKTFEKIGVSCFSRKKCQNGLLQNVPNIIIITSPCIWPLSFGHFHTIFCSLPWGRANPSAGDKCHKQQSFGPRRSYLRNKSGGFIWP